jgi:RNA polymerase sigma-70 factor, ECF subfamily
MQIRGWSWRCWPWWNRRSAAIRCAVAVDGIAVRQIRRHRWAEARRPAPDRSDRAVERVTAERLGPRLAAVVAGLPQQDRELLLLIAWAELSRAEAAAAPGTTTGAVKARLHRIKVRMRRELGGRNLMNEESNDE